MNERWIGFLPLYHAYGQLNTMLMVAKLRIPIYIMSAFVYEDMLQVIQNHRITELSVAPPILVLMSKHPATANYDLSSVTRIFSGAAPLSQSLQSECSQRFKTSVGQGWGMTEVTCAGLVTPSGIEDYTGGVGLLLPNCEVMLIDENGKEVGEGERGEIFIRGPNVSPGYWKNEKATKETMLDGGWLRSGDVALCDQRGWFYIVDRLKVVHHVSAGFGKISADQSLKTGTHQGLRPPSRSRRTRSCPPHPPRHRRRGRRRRPRILRRPRTSPSLRPAQVQGSGERAGDTRVDQDQSREAQIFDGRCGLCGRGAQECGGKDSAQDAEGVGQDGRWAAGEVEVVIFTYSKPTWEYQQHIHTDRERERESAKRASPREISSIGWDLSILTTYSFFLRG